MLVLDRPQTATIQEQEIDMLTAERAYLMAELGKRYRRLTSKKFIDLGWLFEYGEQNLEASYSNFKAQMRAELDWNAMEEADFLPDELDTKYPGWRKLFVLNCIKEEEETPVLADDEEVYPWLIDRFETAPVAIEKTIAELLYS